MQIGMRIIYNTMTGKVLNGTLGEMEGDIQNDLRPNSISFLDLPFGYNENNFKNAMGYYIDVTKSNNAPLSERIVIEEYISETPSLEDQIRELEDQILLLEDEKVGGIL